ncbi:MAG: hypothetical protein QOG53_2613 [Frankiales bacterium]|nr:hypothetical protein [Frankiales bacterium]
MRRPWRAESTQNKVGDVVSDLVCGNPLTLQPHPEYLDASKYDVDRLINAEDSEGALVLALFDHVADQLTQRCEAGEQPLAPLSAQGLRHVGEADVGSIREPVKLTDHETAQPARSVSFGVDFDPERLDKCGYPVLDVGEEEGFFVREVAIERATCHARSRCHVTDGRGVVPLLGEHLAPCGKQLTADAGVVAMHPAHFLDSVIDQAVSHVP